MSEQASQTADRSLAPALQSGLQRITASWRQLRAIHVYRDETDIPTTSALLPKIKEALKESEFFILLASPLAAASPWVRIEADYWLSLNTPEKFLIVLTEGEEPVWDQAAKDFLWEENIPLPPSLMNRFNDEPKFTDLRWARGQKKLKLRERRFYEAVADLASTLRGVDKSTLVGEDARRLRQNRRLAWSAVLALLILSLTSSATAVVAFKQRNRALNQEAIARVNAEEANKQRKAAEDSAREALKQQGIAKANEETATANEKEAKTQEGIANDNAAEAKHQQGIAETNAAEAKRQQGIAETNLAQAQHESRLNLSQRLATQSDSQILSQPQRAGLWAAEAVEATELKDGNMTAQASVAANRALATISGAGLHGYFRESVTDAVFDKDETLLAASDWGGTVQVYDLTKPFPESQRNVIRTEQFSVLVTFDRASRRLITHSRSQDCAPGWSFEHNKTRGCGPGLIWDLDERKKYSDAPTSLSEPLLESMAASSDKSVLAAATNHEIILYDLTQAGTPSVIRRLSKSVIDKISVLEFSRDDHLLLSGSQNGWVQVWDLTSSDAKPKTWFESKHTAIQLGGQTTVPIEILHITDDRSALITASRNWVGSSTEADLSAKLWKLENLKPVGTPRLLNHEQAIASANFLPSSQSVVTTSLDGEVRQWPSDANDTSAPKILVMPRCDCNPADSFKNIHSATIFPDESFVAIATSDGTIKLINLKDAHQKPIELRGLDSSPDFVTVSPKGRWLVSGGVDRSLRVWRTDRGELGSDANRIGDWRTHYVASTVSPSGTTAALFTGHEIEVWDLPNSNSSHRLFSVRSSVGTQECPTCQIELSPDGKWVIVQSDDERNKSTVYAVNGSTKFTIPVRTWNESPFSPDSSWLIVEEPNGSRLYDLSRLPVASVTLEKADEKLYFGSTPFSKDSSWIFAKVSTFNKSQKVAGYLWRIDSRQRDVHRFQISDFEIGQVQFSPDGSWFAYSANDAGDYLDRTGLHLQIDNLEPPEVQDQKEVTRVALVRLSRDAEKLETIKLYGQELKPNALFFSPDGQWLLTATREILARDRLTRVRLWNLRKTNFPEAAFILPSLDRYVREAVFSPDGRFLVTIQGTDDFARLWRLDRSAQRFVAAGILRAALPRRNYHWSVVFAPDSMKVAISNWDDPTPYIWFLTPDGSPPMDRQLHTGGGHLQNMVFAVDNTKLFITSSTTHGTKVNMFDVADRNKEAPVMEILNINEERAGLRFTEDGRELLVVGNDLRRLTIQNGDSLVTKLGTAVGRNMTWEEWVLSGQSGPYHKTFLQLPADESVLRELAQRVSADDRKTSDGVPLGDLMNWVTEFDEPDVCNELAWSLAMVGKGRESLRMAECALKHSPNVANYRDTRGVARALLGDSGGAIEDFDFFVRSAAQNGAKTETIDQRREWIRDLSEGRNPFLPKARK